MQQAKTFQTDPGFHPKSLSSMVYTGSGATGVYYNAADYHRKNSGNANSGIEPGEKSNCTAKKSFVPPVRSVVPLKNHWYRLFRYWYHQKITRTTYAVIGTIKKSLVPLMRSLVPLKNHPYHVKIVRTVKKSFVPNKKLLIQHHRRAPEFNLLLTFNTNVL